MYERFRGSIDQALTTEKPERLNQGLFVGVTAQRPVSSSINCNRHLLVFLDLTASLTAKQ